MGRSAKLCFTPILALPTQQMHTFSDTLLGSNLYLWLTGSWGVGMFQNSASVSISKVISVGSSMVSTIAVVWGWRLEGHVLLMKTRWLEKATPSCPSIKIASCRTSSSQWWKCQLCQLCHRHWPEVLALVPVNS